jgi:hypothetical protein
MRVVALLSCLALVACVETDPIPTAKADAKSTDAGTASDVGQLDSNPIGQLCAASADCQKQGLPKCQVTNAALGEGFCTKPCASDGDCGANRFCNVIGKELVCTTARFCNACTSSADCSKQAPLCLQDKTGRSYCTKKCAPGDGSCAPGASCTAYGKGVNENACQPDYGSCSGDGSQCTPCTGQADCSPGTQCYTSTDTGERFCAKTCQPGASGACAPGYGCEPMTGKWAPGLCLKVIGEDLIATCAKGDKGFCDECQEDYQCASKRCVAKDGEKFCAEAKPCAGNSDCPYGGEATFCVPTDKGPACAPPPAFHCQGFKICLGHACASNETCNNGICQ